MTKHVDGPISDWRLKRADLKENVSRRLGFEADAAACAAVAERLGFLAVRKLRFDGQLTPVASRDWQLVGTLGATIEQACVVTLKPVVTRIEEKVERRYSPDFSPETESIEIEMDPDTSLEPLGSEVDIGRAVEETLALAAPIYPRTPDARLEKAAFSAPGTEPLTDQDMKPFATLSNLRDKLAKGE